MTRQFAQVTVTEEARREHGVPALNRWAINCATNTCQGPPPPSTAEITWTPRDARGLVVTQNSDDISTWDVLVRW